jgi:myo-inositol-1(or 4)-monophosphatase
MTDLDLLIEAAGEAGELALRYRAAGLKISAKVGGSPLTDGDLAVDSLLKERLLGARPDYGWLSEETADTGARLDRRRLFVVDPIDGTTAYIQGAPWFSISMAVIEDGRPVAGVVCAPALDQLYCAEIGETPRLNGAVVRASDRAELEDCAMITDSRALAAADWPPMAVSRRNSIALRLCMVASGEFDAMVSVSHLHEWDMAAGDLIASLAGAVVTDAAGRPIAYNRAIPKSRGLICANPSLQALIRNTLGSIGEPRPL